MTIKARFSLPIGFFIFICYIIFLADTADYNFAFRVVGQIPYGDKICHALLYGMMALFLNYGLGFRSYAVSGRGDTSLQLGSLIVLTFAAIEEFSQYFIASRTFDLWDLGADIVGVGLFTFASLSYIKSRNILLEDEKK